MSYFASKIRLATSKIQYATRQILGVGRKNALRSAAARSDRREIRKAWNRVKAIQVSLDLERKESKPNQKRIADLEAERKALRARITKLEKQRDLTLNKRELARSRREQKRQVRRGWIAKRTIYRSRYQRAKAKAQPSFESWMLNGRPDCGLPRSLKTAIAVAVTKYDQVVTSTNGGTHSPTSWHYSCRAVDIAGPYDGMIGFQKWLAENRGAGCLEIFGPDSYYYKNGSKYQGAFPAHGDHIHYADD